MMTVRLMKFPYPYRAAVTICSDIDGTSFENFMIIHEFLNSGKETVLGRGLNLPIGDSFWMYDMDGNPDAAFSYFEGYTAKESKYAPYIRDFIKAGVIDVMHSYGNFSEHNKFSREHAIRAINELDRHSIKLGVWTNHGGLTNVQNLGANSVGYGDVPQSDYYHADLLLEYGVKFYWDSELSLHTNVGQDASSRYGDAYWHSTLYGTPIEYMKYSLKGLLSYADELQQIISSRKLIAGKRFNSLENELIIEEQLRDGSAIHRFKRFGQGRYDWSDDLPRLVNIAFLDKLVEKRGYSIVYIHLGDRKIKSDTRPLSRSTVDAFTLLADYYQLGKVWVSNTSTILRYNFIRKNLEWCTRIVDDTLIIDINGLKSPHKDFVVTSDDIQGISFLCLEGCANIVVQLNNQVQKDIIEYSDNTGRRIITVPNRDIEWPLI
ncbi:hypothetical protein JXB12_04645 [candidate division KSB1 bacterium]|nr:hypothetical protein [candidate division KSB1 bacterium]